VWISSYQPSVASAGANTVPSGRGGALIKADPATANSVYTSFPDGDYSSPVIHTVSGCRWLLRPHLSACSHAYEHVSDITLLPAQTPHSG